METFNACVRMPKELYKTVSDRAVLEGCSATELIRRYIKKGLDIDGYKSETEFIRNILRQELESIIEPLGNRIIKMQMKVGKVSAGGFFIMLRNLFGTVAEENRAAFNGFIQRYMGMGVDYMQMKDKDVNKFLTADGTKLSEL